jgi:hypothetical protein
LGRYPEAELFAKKFLYFADQGIGSALGFLLCGSTAIGLLDSPLLLLPFSHSSGFLRLLLLHERVLVVAEGLLD